VAALSGPLKKAFPPGEYIWQPERAEMESTNVEAIIDRFRMRLWYIGKCSRGGTMRSMETRIGHGYDQHRLEPSEDSGTSLLIGGVGVQCGLQAIAHSDGDAVMHAITDALLSAIGEPDIGALFPDTAPENENRDSGEFLSEAMHRVNTGGWAICNIDITVICDQPKIAPIREQICENVRRYTVAPVNIKGKTHEGTDTCGAIEVHVVALLQRGNTDE